MATHLWLVLLISAIGLFLLCRNAVLFSTNRKVKNNVSKVFIGYLISLSVIEVFCHIIGFTKPNTNIFLSHIYFCFQFTFLSILYYSLITNKLFKKIIVLAAILQTIAISYTYINEPELFWDFNLYEITSSSLLLIIYALFFIFENLDKKHQYFNFSIGLILYLSCSLAIFTSGKLELVLCEKPYIDIWVFNSIFYIIFQYFVYREYVYVKKMK